MNVTFKYFNLYLLTVGILLACVGSMNAQPQSPGGNPTVREGAAGKATAGNPNAKPAAGENPTAKQAAGGNPTVKEGAGTQASAEPKVIGQKIQFADGSTGNADEVFKLNGELWIRRGSVTERITRSVKSVETVREPVEKPREAAGPEAPAATETAANPPAPDSFWVLLKGGARMKVDEVTQNEEGAWCRRGNFSVLISADRIEGIESASAAKPAGGRQRDWTTGNIKIDQLIRANGTRFGVDPYLVFCVIEHESQFHPNALSPKGAQGLMQLMPGTASRFGVKRPYDPAENIYGGTQYLKELLKMFNGRIDLALASYNAGEGAVLKYGGNVPPYRETRDYVKRITRRYGGDATVDKSSPAPR